MYQHNAKLKCRYIRLNSIKECLYFLIFVFLHQVLNSSLLNPTLSPDRVPSHSKELNFFGIQTSSSSGINIAGDARLHRSRDSIEWRLQCKSNQYHLSIQEITCVVKPQSVTRQEKSCNDISLRGNCVSFVQMLFVVFFSQSFKGLTLTCLCKLSLVTRYNFAHVVILQLVSLNTASDACRGEVTSESHWYLLASTECLPPDRGL